MSTRAAHLRRRPRVPRARMKPRRMVQAQPGPQTSGTAQADEEHEQLPYVLLPQEAWRRRPYGRGNVPYSPRQAPKRSVCWRASRPYWLGQILPPVVASSQLDFRRPVSSRNAICWIGPRPTLRRAPHRYLARTDRPFGPAPKDDQAAGQLARRGSPAVCPVADLIEGLRCPSTVHHSAQRRARIAQAINTACRIYPPSIPSQPCHEQTASARD
jgi:hypothetical protein